jgi:hypothetical protein
MTSDADSRWQKASTITRILLASRNLETPAVRQLEAMAF